jgi:archaellum component FlaG (FlaF/FlaG flagellin family)
LDKVLTTALLTIAAIVAAVMVVNAILPALGTGGASVVSSSQMAADRIKTAIEIIHVAPPVDGKIRFWVKNVGATDIPVSDQIDVFVEDSNGQLYPSAFDESGVCPGEVSDSGWFKSDGGDPWTPSDTIGITVCLEGIDINIKDLRTVHFTTANGVTDKKSF